MKLVDKIKLVELLRLYQTEKAEQNLKREKDKYGMPIPTKSLYTHARVLATKLSMEIEKELKSIYQ